MEKISVSDLSIGDWVCAEVSCGVHIEPRLTPPMKVVGLGESWVNLEIDPEQGDPFEYEPHEIRGVPITVEVLEKNGFYLIIDTCRIDTYSREGIYISMFSIPKITIIQQESYLIKNSQVQYVHQLQHALRLAGVGKEIVI